MRVLISCLLSAFVILSGSSVCQAALLITEIMNNPSGTDGTVSNSQEWFELFNSNATVVNLGNIKWDDDLDASDGQTLSGILTRGQYAIVANLAKSTWEGFFGALPAGTIFVQIPNPNWQVLNNASGDTISRYNTTTATNFLTTSYGTTTNGVALQYAGTRTPYLVGPSAWTNATTIGGGTSGDKHSAGSSPLHATPEPASFALLALAGFGLAVVIRRQRHAVSMAQM